MSAIKLSTVPYHGTNAVSSSLDTQSEDPPDEDPLPADSQEHPPATTDPTENLRPDPSDIPSEEDTLPSDDDVPLLAAVTDVTLADQPASSTDRVLDSQGLLIDDQRNTPTPDILIPYRGIQISIVTCHSYYRCIGVAYETFMHVFKITGSNQLLLWKGVALMALARASGGDMLTTIISRGNDP